MLFCKNISQWASKSSKQLHVNRTLLPQKISFSNHTSNLLLNYRGVSLAPYSTISNKIISPNNPILSEFNGKSHLADRLNTILLIHKTIRQNGRNIFGASTGKRLKDLETRANSNPNDADVQAKYMKELIKTKPLEVQKRFESRNFIMNEESEKCYLLALAKLNKYEDIRIENFLGRKGGSYSGGSGGSTQGTFGHSGKPIPVVVTKTWAGVLWNFMLSPWLIILVILGIIVYWPRGSSSSMEDLFTVQKTHDLVTKVTTKFDDVKGVDEAKEELQEVVDFLKNPSKYAKIGARLPKGILLTGPPGTGKTLMARAIAGEAGVPFFYCSGSSFEEVFVGVGSKRIRQLFEDARKSAPCIIFIDEIDSVGGKRSKYSLNSRDNTLNQLLTEIDGFQQTKGIMVVAATNFPESLDKALTRPGRFDKQIVVSLPDVKGRKSIVDLYLSKTKPASDVDSSVIARGIPGFTGADIQNLINLAAIKAALKGKSVVDMRAIEEAKDDILMGVKRKTEQTRENLKFTAYHEGGHALVAHYTPGADPVHKLTIIQRGRALGVTVQLPEGERLSYSRKQMMAHLAVCMGGRAAEELIFGDDHVTNGASSDIEAATSLARAMVLHWGMNNKIGQVWHDEEKMSESERKIVDDEVRILIQQSYDYAQTLLKNHERELHSLADALLEHEILSGEQMKDILSGKKLGKAIESSQAGKMNTIL